MGQTRSLRTLKVILLFRDIIDRDDLYWSLIQQTYDENSITIGTTIYHSGGKSARSYAIAPLDDEKASKASINKQHMAFWSGETVEVDFWIYLEGNDPMDWPFIFDIEEKTTVGAGPGMRLHRYSTSILNSRH